MVVITKGTINRYQESYPEAEGALNRFYLLTKTSSWSNHTDLLNTFPSADYVGNGLYVVDLMGTKYRIIIRVIFGARTVFIRFFGTHTEYDKVDIGSL